MSEPVGSFVLVLHGHIPYVLGHGTWPHGAQMLYEAVVDTDNKPAHANPLPLRTRSLRAMSNRNRIRRALPVAGGRPSTFSIKTRSGS